MMEVTIAFAMDLDLLNCVKNTILVLGVLVIPLLLLLLVPFVELLPQVAFVQLLVMHKHL
jgi:hypothetical protein